MIRSLKYNYIERNLGNEEGSEGLFKQTISSDEKRAGYAKP